MKSWTVQRLTTALPGISLSVLSFRLRANVLPWTRFAYVKVKAGKAAEFRKAWEKYNKPVYDKLVADGVILAYGLAMEEVRTKANHPFRLGEYEKPGGHGQVAHCFIADRDRRSQEEQDAMSSLFASLLDLDASRQEVTRSMIFHLASRNSGASSNELGSNTLSY